MKQKFDRNPYLLDIHLPLYPTVKCEEVIGQLNKRIREHLLQTAYNNIGMLFHHHQSPFFYQADSYAHYEQFSSGNCIGLTLGVLKNILLHCHSWKDIMKFPSIYVIPATLPPHYGKTNGFGHVALLVVCSDGVILIDSGFHIPQAIILKNEKIVSVTVGEKIWRFQLIIEGPSGSKISGTINASVESPRFGKEEFKYLLRHISNPDGIILKTNMADTRKVSYVSRDWEGIQTNHITIDLENQLIKMFSHRRNNDKNLKAEVHFSEYDHDIWDIRLRLYGCPPYLVKQIKCIISSELDTKESVHHYAP